MPIVKPPADTGGAAAPGGSPAPVLLAVDLGLRTGLAAFARDGRLRYARSQHRGTRAAMRRAASGVLAGLPGLVRLVLEGGGDLADLWEREASRYRLAVLRVSAETWRAALLHPSERRDAAAAKKAAGVLARGLFADAGLARPRRLTTDSAEAVCCGLWAVWTAGWLETWPASLAGRPGGCGARRGDGRGLSNIGDLCNIL